MSDLDDIARGVWGMVAMMVRSNSAPAQETGCKDKDGADIRTGDLLELWMSPDKGFHSAEPAAEVGAVREVLVVHERDGKFFGVDYDILQGIEVPELAEYATVRGNVDTDEGLEYLRMGLMRFNGEGVDDDPSPTCPNCANLEFVDARATGFADAPSPEELASVRPGDHVKVCAKNEKFWIKVTAHNPPEIVGEVANDLTNINPAVLSAGDTVTVEERHVYMILPEGEP